MPLTEEERILQDIQALWKKSDHTVETVQDLKTRQAILSERFDTLERNINESNGRLDAQLTRIDQGLESTRETMIRIAERIATKGTLLDRWLGPLIGLLAIAVSVVSLFKATA